MDPRTAATKSNIKRAFVRIAEDTPIEQISVSALCKEVGIPRQTFYYHYASWQRLIEDVIDDEMQVYYQILMNADGDLVTAVRKQLDAMDQHRSFHKRLEEASLEGLLIKKMADCAKNAFTEKWMEGISHKSEHEAEMNFSFFVAGFYNLVLDSENKYSREEVIDFVVKLLRFQHKLIAE